METSGALLAALTESSVRAAGVCSSGVCWPGTGSLHQFLCLPQGGLVGTTWEIWLGVRSDPWGRLFLLPFGEGAPVAKIKLGWGCGSSKGRGCHLLCYTLNQGSTNSSLWFNWRLFIFSNGQHITMLTSRTLWRTSCIPLLYDRKCPHLIRNSLRLGSAAFPSIE